MLSTKGFFVSHRRRTIAHALTLGAATAATLLVSPTGAHASTYEYKFAGHDGRAWPQLPAACSQPDTYGGDVVCTFKGTGREQVFEVPKATPTTKLTIDAIGARGGSQGAASGGAGGRVTMMQTFNAGQRLYIEVGTPGQSVPGLAGAGGFNGGGGGAPGQTGGGGASDIRTISRTSPSSLESRMLVAGGGGGGCKTSTTTTSGGAAGRDGIGSLKVTPGRGATNGPGVGGHDSLIAGSAGKLGQGGTGAITIAPGCGGGGGWYGGGGSIARSGAGGGSNYPLAAATSTVLDKDAVVVIRYTLKAGPNEMDRSAAERWVVALHPGTTVVAGTPITLSLTYRNVDGAALLKWPNDLSLCDPGAWNCAASRTFDRPGTYSLLAIPQWQSGGRGYFVALPVTVTVLAKK